MGPSDPPAGDELEPPEYLRDVAGLTPELARLAEESELRELSRGERRILDLAIAAAATRVREAGRRRADQAA